MIFSSHSPSQTPSPASSSSGTGLEGTISLGPTHGGPVREGVPSTAPFADKDFVVTEGEREVASFKTDSHGNFKVSLPPGHYTVAMKEKRSNKIGHFGPWEVDVAAGKMNKVDWQCDTGMR
jgi:hypothetical protein